MSFLHDWFPVLFPLSFVGLWLTVGFFISRMGWHAFAQKYAAPSRPRGRSFTCRSAQFGIPFAHYRNVMRIVFSESGIYVYPLFLFRAFHDPFLVPWEKVIGVSEQKGFLRSWRELYIRDGSEEIYVRLSDEALREFQRFHKI